MRRNFPATPPRTQTEYRDEMTPERAVPEKGGARRESILTKLKRKLFPSTAPYVLFNNPLIESQEKSSARPDPEYLARARALFDQDGICTAVHRQESGYGGNPSSSPLLLEPDAEHSCNRHPADLVSPTPSLDRGTETSALDEERRCAGHHNQHYHCDDDFQTSSQRERKDVMRSAEIIFFPDSSNLFEDPRTSARPPPPSPRATPTKPTPVRSMASLHQSARMQDTQGNHFRKRAHTLLARDLELTTTDKAKSEAVTPPATGKQQRARTTTKVEPKNQPFLERRWKPAVSAQRFIQTVARPLSDHLARTRRPQKQPQPTSAPATWIELQVRKSNQLCQNQGVTRPKGRRHTDCEGSADVQCLQKENEQMVLALQTMYPDQTQSLPSARNGGALPLDAAVQPASPEATIRLPDTFSWSTPDRLSRESMESRDLLALALEANQKERELDNHANLTLAARTTWKAAGSTVPQPTLMPAADEGALFRRKAAILAKKSAALRGPAKGFDSTHRAAHHPGRERKKPIWPTKRISKIPIREPTARVSKQATVTGTPLERANKTANALQYALFKEVKGRLESNLQTAKSAKGGRPDFSNIKSRVDSGINERRLPVRKEPLAIPLGRMPLRSRPPSSSPSSSPRRPPSQRSTNFGENASTRRAALIRSTPKIQIT